MNQPLLVTASQKAGPRVTLAIAAVAALLLLALALLSLLPAGHALQVSAYTLTLVGKILCYAIVALALDLVWGYAGLLSLCLLYTSPSPRDLSTSRMPSSA